MTRVLSLILLVAMPLVTSVRAATAPCQQGHAVHVAGPVGTAGEATVSGGAAEARAIGDRHEHVRNLHGGAALPVSCGTAAVAERPSSAPGALLPADLPDWEAYLPRTAAAPPPAPPPRLD